MAVVAYNSGLDIERMFAVAQNLTFDTNNEGNFYHKPRWTPILKIEHHKCSMFHVREFQAMIRDCPT